MKSIADQKRQQILDVMTVAIRDIPDEFVDLAASIFNEIMKASGMKAATPASVPQAVSELESLLRQFGFRVATSADGVNHERLRSDLRIEQRAAEIAAAWFTHDEDQWNQTLWAPLPCPDCEQEAHELAREIAGVLF